MINKQSIHWVTSDRTQHFTEPLGSQASEYESLVIGGSGPVKGFITNVAMHCATQHTWRVFFFSRGTPYWYRMGATPYKFSYLGHCDLTAQTGILGGTQYIYASDALAIPYEDEDAGGRLHIGLMNLTNATKLGPSAAGGAKPAEMADDALYLALRVGMVAGA